MGEEKERKEKEEQKEVRERDEEQLHTKEKVKNEVWGIK